MLKLLSTCFMMACLSVCARAQDSTRLDKALSLPDKLFGLLDRKAAKAQSGLDHATDKYLSKLQKREEKLKRKLMKRDSTAAKQLFGDIDGQYASLRKARTKAAQYAPVYSGHLDSLATTLRFLQSANRYGPQAGQALEKLQGLQSKLDATEDIRRYLVRRQQYLKEQFSRLGMMKELKQFRKTVYYYQAQVREYKEAFEDPAKLESKLFALAGKMPLFRDFFARNSQIASLFRVPASAGVSNTSTAGLQTRYAAQQMIAARTTSNPTQFLQAQLKAANEKAVSQNLPVQLPSLKKSAPDQDFKPNSQKTKPFKKRIQKGIDLHFGKVNNFFPTSADVGFSLGYKLNDNSVVGVGAGYNFYLGRSFSDIQLSRQGHSLRTYLDWRLKGSFFLHGGYEKIYQRVPAGYTGHIDQWQESGLLGLAKKYTIRKKFSGNLQLLYDFLSYKSFPRREPLIFRVGYNF